VKNQLRAKVGEKLADPRMVTEVAVDQRQLRLEAAQAPGVPAGADQGNNRMAVRGQSPDQVRADPPRSSRDERRRMIAIAVSDA
jgi:hypothetical protein